jgi:hypothetical protein
MGGTWDGRRTEAFYLHRKPAVTDVKFYRLMEPSSFTSKQAYVHAHIYVDYWIHPLLLGLANITIVLNTRPSHVQQ